MSENRSTATYKTDQRQLWLALLSGIFLWLSYPPLRVGWLAWVALVPLSTAAFINAGRPKPGKHSGIAAALLGGALWGFGLFHPLLFTTEGSWSQRLSGLIILIVLLAVTFVAYFVYLTMLYGRWPTGYIVVPLAASGWVLIEFLVRWIAVGFAPYLGVTQWQQPTLLSVAASVGIHGISWLVAAGNTALAVVSNQLANAGWLGNQSSLSRIAGPRRHAHQGLWLAVGIVGLVAAIGSAVDGLPGYLRSSAVATVPSRPLRLLLVQPNIENERYYQIDRTNVGHYELMQQLIVQTEEALANIPCPPGTATCPDMAVPTETADGRDLGPLLVVWPETVLHIPGADDAKVQVGIGELMRRWDVGLVIGMPRRAGTVPALGTANDLTTMLYNSVFVYGADGRVKGTYDKIHVIPIAEGQFTAGTETKVVQYENHFLGLGICSDIVVPGHARHTVLAGAHTLHYIASFGQVARLAPLATALAAFRAAEHRIYVVQTATTGPSAVIDPRGQFVASVPTDKAAALLVTVPTIKGRLTVYTRFGDWIVAVAGVFVAFTGWRTRRDKSVPTTASQHAATA